MFRVHPIVTQNLYAQPTVSCCAAADTKGAIHGVVPQSPVRRGGAQPLLPLVHGYLDAALVAASRRPSWQPLASDRGAFLTPINVR